MYGESGHSDPEAAQASVLCLHGFMPMAATSSIELNADEHMLHRFL